MEITIGTKVRYARKWLRSTGMFSGPIPFAKGIVTKIEGSIATVDWKNNEIPSKILISNLSIVGRPELD